MPRRLARVTYAQVYDAVLEYMRRRRFEDVDRLADRVAETLAQSLSGGLDTTSTVAKLLRLNSRSFSLNRSSKSEFASDIERHVRAEMNRLPLSLSAPTLRETILGVLDLGDSPDQDTAVFRGKNHDILLRHFADWLRERLNELGFKAPWAVSQGPSDQGVDAIMEVTNGVAGRVGIQLENDTTIRKNDFKEQMARVYGLYDINEVDLLIIVFCGDETNRSVQMKVRHQIAIAAQKKDRNLITIEPTKALSILGPHLES